MFCTLAAGDVCMYCGKREGGAGREPHRTFRQSRLVATDADV
jgi:hypothetical protein